MKHRRDDRAAWLVSTLISELQAARHKALLISPYFVPGNEGLDGFSAMAGRGVQVGVVTNSLAANDVAAVHGGYMSYRVPLLEAGVHLYELKAHGQSGDAGMFGSSGASLHTKAFVVDDRRGFVGSFNLDPRSAYLNTEMGVLFDDPVLGRNCAMSTCAWRTPGTAGGWRWTTEGYAGWSVNRHRTGWRPNPARAWASAGPRGPSAGCRSNRSCSTQAAGPAWSCPASSSVSTLRPCRRRQIQRNACGGAEGSCSSSASMRLWLACPWRHNRLAAAAALARRRLSASALLHPPPGPGEPAQAAPMRRRPAAPTATTTAATSAGPTPAPRPRRGPALPAAAGALPVTRPVPAPGPATARRKHHRR